MTVKLETQIQQLLRSAPASDLSTLTPDEILTKKALDSHNNTGPEVFEEERQIPTHDGNRTITLTITRPIGSEKQPLPIILYLHGGGWVFGDAQTHKRVRTELTVRAQAAVVFVNYTRTPEARFPTALEECYDAMRWTFENGASMLMNPSKLAVVGDSAGGNLTAALCLLAKRRGQANAIKYAVLYYPTVDADFYSPASYHQFAENYDLTANEMRFFWDLYVPDAARRHDPLAAPLQASLEELRGLPPTMVVTAEADVLRDEAESFARKLLEACVPVVNTRYLGTIHGFATFDTLTPSGDAVLNHTAAELNNAWSGGTHHA